MLVLTRDAYRAILDHATEDAPREACGILAGRREGDRTLVERAHRVPNVAPTPRLTYAMDPEAQFQTMETVETHGQSIVGFYHSHPAGPAGPSETDRDRARWPGHHYLIVSLARRPAVVDAWRWEDERFVAVDVAIEPPGED